MWGAAWGDERASRRGGSGRYPGRAGERRTRSSAPASIRTCRRPTERAGRTGADDGRLSPPRLLERSDHGSERQETVVAAQRRGVEAGDRAVEEQRVRGMQAVA